MAELDTKPAATTGNKVKTHKKSIRVDLTAMVDLAFLLITFFILTTTLQKPNAMNLAMPDVNGSMDYLAVLPGRTMTILLGANNKLEWFMGSSANPITAPTVEGFGKDGIRKSLLTQSDRVKQTQGKDMIVLVKAGAHANYANMVNVMDELNIANIQRRAVVDITPGEVDLLKRDHIFER